jgi:hypothetical protein
VAAHLESLLRLRVLEPHLGFVVLAALGMAPPKYWIRIDALVAEAARHQRDDGSWPDVTRAAPFIAAQQVPSGAFDPTENEANALTALRALLTAQTAHRTG